jgi:hypothetical protein
MQAAAASSALEGGVLQPNVYRPSMYHSPWRLVYSQQERDGDVNWLATAEINKAEPDARPVPRLTEVRFDPPVLSTNPQRPTRVSVKLDAKLPVKRVEGVLMEGNVVPPNNQHYMFPLYDSGNAQNGDEKQGDGVYSALVVVPAHHAGTQRSVRLSAEVEDEQKLHHAWSAQLGPLPAAAELPEGVAPLAMRISTDRVGAIASAPAGSSATNNDDDDARRALDMSVGLIPVDLALDVDQDGVVTAGDARVLLQQRTAE